MVKNFCDELLHHLCPRDLAEGRLATLIQDRLSIRARAAGKELEQLHADLLGAPTTYNRRLFTDTPGIERNILIPPQTTTQ